MYTDFQSIHKSRSNLNICNVLLNQNCFMYKLHIFTVYYICTDTFRCLKPWLNLPHMTIKYTDLGLWAQKCLVFWEKEKGQVSCSAFNIALKTVWGSIHYIFKASLYSNSTALVVVVKEDHKSTAGQGYVLNSTSKVLEGQLNRQCILVRVAL